MRRPRLNALARIRWVVSVLTLVVGLGSAASASGQAPLPADNPLHLEDHLETATVEGSAVPADIPHPIEWRFDEAQPDWQAPVHRNPSIPPLEMTRTEDAIRITLSEAHRDPRANRVHGDIYVPLPDLKRGEWGYVLVRARTSGPVYQFGVQFNLQRDPGPNQEMWQLDGDAVDVISDGSVQTYRLRTDWPLREGEDQWQELGFWFNARGPGSIEILSVRLVPKEAPFADAAVGVRAVGETDIRTLYIHAPGRVEYSVLVPEAGRLDVALGVLRGDVPVTFRVTATPEGGPTETLLEESWADRRRWGQRSVDLSHLAGLTVGLTLAVEADRVGTVALWRAPTLHTPSEVPRTRTFPGVESPAFPYAQPEEVGLSSAKLDRLADEVAQWVAGGEIVGAELLIVKDRRIVLHEAFGWSDREAQRPMERNSLFSIKSMSKPFTATAILMLEEDGKLSLTDPVSRYVPTFTNDSTTIHHLLTHTSGYEGLGDTEDFVSLKKWVEDWAATVATRPLGQYSYSDFNYAALGYVVEAVSGVPVEAFIEEQILRPLGLDETYTAFSPDAPWADRMNSRYRWDEEAGTYWRFWSNEDDQPWQFYPAAWGLYSTAMDYAEFLEMWMDKGSYGGTRLLTEESVEHALQLHAQTTDGGYGYGWSMRKAPREEEMPGVFSHGGYDGTRAWAFPAVDAMVIWLTHSRGRGHKRALINRLGMLEIFDHPGPYARSLVWAGDQDVAAVDLSPVEQDRYVGTYRGKSSGREDAPEIVVRVWQHGGRLHYRVGESGERMDTWLHLVPLGGHRFHSGRYRGDRLEAIGSLATIVRFVVEDGQATGFEVIVEDQVRFSAQRTQ